MVKARTRKGKGHDRRRPVQNRNRHAEHDRNSSTAPAGTQLQLVLGVHAVSPDGTAPRVTAVSDTAGNTWGSTDTTLLGSPAAGSSYTAYGCLNPVASIGTLTVTFACAVNAVLELFATYDVVCVRR